MMLEINNRGYVPPIYSILENLVLRARSEMIGSALDQLCFWVSGVRCQKDVPIMGVQNFPDLDSYSKPAAPKASG